MNVLFRKTWCGTLGELIAQTHLLTHGVQAAPPIKDSGNDLIGVRKQSFRAIQVRTSSNGSINKPNPKRLYHILAVVHLPFDENFPLVSQARVFLFPKEDVKNLAGRVFDYEKNEISRALVEQLWPDRVEPAATNTAA